MSVVQQVAASGKALGSMMHRWGPVIWRSNLYFWATFLASLSDKITDILMKDTWPSSPRWFAGILAGTIGGLIALRAYHDGSAQRHGENLAKSGQTQFFAKP